VEAEDTAALLRSGKKRRLWTPSATTRAVDHGRAEIERLLPHRDPFLFVERITAIDLEQKAIEGTRRIDPKDPIFKGHFPSYPIYPGVLELETMGQLGICLASFFARSAYDVPPDAVPQNVRALKIHTAMFLTEVLPGDDVTILATLVENDGYGAICAGQLLKGDTISAFAVMEVYLVDA
jgi:3-hydroxymyristoyl/3-hydroxydecanoyl-(acyl carrier protein) dehydratase